MIKSKGKLIALLTVLLLTVFMIVSCDNDDGVAGTQGSGTVSMKLGDSPFPIDLVARADITVDKIDLRSATETGPDDGPRIYLVLDEPQTFNLINFRNGLTADLPDVEVNTGSYDQVRFYISDAEVELIDGKIYDLKVPSGAASGLKVFIDPPLQVNADVTYQVLLDFDLTKSFVVQGNPNTPAGIKGFIFKPVIRAVNLSAAGSIYGLVTDDQQGVLAGAHVWVEQDTVISSTYTEIDGTYRIIGLPAGSYDIFAEYTGLMPESVEQVNVSSGSATEVNFELQP